MSFLGAFRTAILPNCLISFRHMIAVLDLKSSMSVCAENVLSMISNAFKRKFTCLIKRRSCSASLAQTYKMIRDWEYQMSVQI